MKQLLRAIMAFTILMASIASAADLPSGALGVVSTGTSSFSTYNYTFTPTVSGNDYVLFAFRQDPAFWNFGNVLLTTSTAPGINLLSNGNMVNGGTINVTLNGGGTAQVAAPTNWGVFYQTGTVPMAAGTWQSQGGPNGGGAWYDGAVGSFDGIYQAVNVTAGTTYDLSFMALSTYGVNSGSSIQIGTYVGPCSSLSVSLTGCTLPTNLGFTTLSTPAQGAGAVTPGAPVPPSPSAPTIVSTAAGVPIVQSTASTGTTVNTSLVTLGVAVGTALITDTASRQPHVVDVNRNTTVTVVTPVTTTVTHTTPVTTTTVTTPTVVTTWSDGSTTTANGTAVTTTSVVNTVTTTATTANNVQVASSNNAYTTRVDTMDKLSNINQRINQRLDSSPLDRFSVESSALRSNTDNDKDNWVYLIGDGAKSNTHDTYQTTDQRYGFGAERRVEWNWLVGTQYNHVNSSLSGDQAGGSLTKDHFGVYSLYAYNDWLLKSDIGTSVDSYLSNHSLNALGYSNSAKTHGYDLWASNRVYTPSVFGFRPYAGIRTEYNNRDSVTESGSLLTSVTYNKINTTGTSAEAGVRYEYNVINAIKLVGDVSTTSDSLTTARLGLNFVNTTNLTGGISITEQRQYGVVNNIAQATLKYSF